MIFVLFAVLSLVVINAEDVQDEITSNVIIEKSSSTEKAIEAREYVAKNIIPPRPGLPMKNRRSRYLRQAPRPRRRPPFGPRTMRRPVNNFPNLYGPRSRFKPSPPYRSMPPPKSRYRYRDSWRHKWPEHHQPGPAYVDEDDMEIDPSYEEYDDIEDYKGDNDLWYSPKKYREMYEDTVPTSSKYNEKRSPSRYVTTFDFSRPKVRANYDLYEGVAMKDPSIEWQDRNRYSKHYRNILEILTNGKKYEEEEPISMHRFKLPNWNRLKQLDDTEYDFSGNTGTNNLKSRRFRTEQAVIRRPVITEDHNNKYDTDMVDISKYFAAMHAAGLPSKEAAQEAVYSAKYRGRDTEKQDDDKSKLKINNEDVPSTDTNILHDWKRTQKQSDFQSQFVATPEKTNGVVADTTTVARNKNYKDDHLSPSELIAYMSADPGESVVGKEERYLHAAYPFSEKLSDHDILKATFPRKISPIIDQDLEITFDDRMGDWKH